MTTEEYTTNAEDQAAVQQLNERLAQSNANDSISTFQAVPNVSLAPGTHKYVLLSAQPPNDSIQHFVTSRHNAPYHRNAAEPYIQRLQQNGYTDIRVTGGGRITFHEEEKKIFIYGYSYGFGLADHAKSKEVILGQEKYKGYNVTWSNDGY